MVSRELTRFYLCLLGLSNGSAWTRLLEGLIMAGLPEAIVHRVMLAACLFGAGAINVTCCLMLAKDGSGSV